MADADDDPLYPWLLAIKSARDDLGKKIDDSEVRLESLVKGCIAAFEKDSRYQNDVRFLRIWVFHADCNQNFEEVYEIMEMKRMFLSHSLLYEAYAVYLEEKGKLVEARRIYQLGISRFAKPLETLKRSYASFLDRIRAIQKACLMKGVKTSLHRVTVINGSDEPMLEVDRGVFLECAKANGQMPSIVLNPWSGSTIQDILKKIGLGLLKYKGYHETSKAYSGKIPLPTVKNMSRNKVIELGKKKYQIKGCAGQGGFAEVFKAHVDSNPDEVVALKIQRPPFPWEFHMYRQLDQRLSGENRSSFGYAHGLHVYSDCSILVCDYLSHGTLQDAINSYVVVGQTMEEVLCMHYTIDMLRMLEILHGVGIVHGDFKPDNLLIRYSRDDLPDYGFEERAGPWSEQGLCLVDWGRGIDLKLFDDGTQFKGDCRTSGFRCTEMKESRTWKFQVDTYALCVNVHMMLHGTYMDIQKKATPDGSYVYQPRLSLKRYWKVDLWSELFTKLLNIGNLEDDRGILQNLRKSFEDYLCGNLPLMKKLKQSLLKQRISLCSS